MIPNSQHNFPHLVRREMCIHSPEIDEDGWGGPHEEQSLKKRIIWGYIRKHVSHHL